MRRFFSVIRTVVATFAIASAMVGTAQAAGKHSGMRKFLLTSGDTSEARVIKSGGKKLADYKTFALWGVSDTTTSVLKNIAGANARGISERLEMRGGKFQDTRRASAANASLKVNRAKDGGGLQVVQFIGPVQPTWIDSLRKTGVKVVSYMPDNAYVVWSNDVSRNAFDAFVASDFVQWSGNFEPSWRRSPRVEAASLTAKGNVDITVQLLDGPETKTTLARLLALASRVIQEPSRVLAYTNVSVSIPTGSLADISSWPDVFNVEEYVVPAKRDEVQGQILAGNLVVSGGNVLPQGPGYLSWLATKGFPTTPQNYPVVDIVDDGIDVGDPVNVRHPDFRRLGDSSQASRLSFIETCTSDPLGDGLEGHGNINAGIVGGYNNQATGFPFQDALGYNYGLGISPYGRLAGTRIFGSSGGWDVSRCGGTETGIIQRAYASGAKITSNSWGASVGGAYTSSSQAYDAGTRDASAIISGNQEILHVFSAGNSGSGSMTIGAPGTAKNVLTVGATENVRAEGMSDGCGISASNNADDIIYFSSRGPTTDGRIKPDIMAPGVHISGPASQDPGFNGGSVCGMGASGAYYPLGQTLYTWSSGTSHSCPAVSGAAQLTYEYYGRVLKPGAVPSPAMIKALLVNGARYLTGLSAGGTLPSANQGWGDVNLGTQFDGTRRELLDQTVVFQQTGDQYANAGQVLDPTKPVRVTLVWTDAPGNTAGASWVNDLDLEVAVNGVVYKGNVFNGALSTTGGVADNKNNIENVFLPAGTTGPVSIRVIAKNIVGDGIPGNASFTDQDFALVAYNVSVTPRAILAADSLLIRKVVGNPLVGIEAGDSIEIRTAIRNAGNLPMGASSGILSTSNSNVRFGNAQTSYSALNAGTRAWGSLAYSLRVSPNLACGSSLALQEFITDGVDTVLRPILLAGRTISIAGSDTSRTVPSTIPDLDSAVATLTPNRSGVIFGVKVRVSLTHTYDADLILSLVSPRGKRVVLANRVGGSSDNFTGTIFDDSATIAIGSGTAPFTGRFKPSESLSALNGDSVQGTWKLVVSDVASTDVGSLSFFSIDFNIASSGCAANTAPFVQIVAPARGRVFAPGDTIPFQATATDDGKPNPVLTYRWKLNYGPASIAFSDTASIASSARLSVEGVYSVGFSAFDGQLTGIDSVTFQVRRPLLAPTGLVATPQPGAIALSWDSATVAGVRFRIYRSVGDSIHFSMWDSTTVNSYLDRGLRRSDTTYFYKVASIRDTFVAIGSQIVWAQPSDSSPVLLPPSNVRGVAGDRKASLTWSPVVSSDGLVSYSVFRRLSTDSVMNLVRIVPDTFFVDTPLVNRTRYVYAVVATNASATSPASALVTVEPYAFPGTVVGLVAHAEGIRIRLDYQTDLQSGDTVAIYRSTTAGGPYQWLANSFDTTYLDSSVSRNVTYYYVAHHLRLGSMSESSSEASAVVVHLPPATPSNFRLVAGDRQIRASWDSVPDVVSYLVKRYLLYPNGSSVETILPATVRSWVDTGLVNGNTYFYTIQASNGAGRGLASDTVSAVPLPPAPAAPTGVVAVGGDRSIHVTWNTVVGASSYTVKIANVSSGPYTVAQSGIVAASYDLTGLVNGATQYIVVSATNGTGEGANSAQVSATPVSPSGLKVLYKVGDANPTDNTIRPLLQIANTGATSVNLSDVTLRYWYTNEQSQGQAFWCDWAQVGSSNVVGTYHTLANSVPGADGYMEVSFLGAAGALAANGNSGEIQVRITRVDWSSHNETGDWSFDATKTAYVDWDHITLYQAGVLVWGKEPVVANPPSVPTGLRGSAGNGVDTLSWAAAANAASYNVYRNVAGGVSVKIVSSSALTFIDTGLVNGTSYVYRVTGVNGSLESAKSDSFSLLPRGVAPAKVTGLVATAGNNLVGLAWNASLTATTYRVVRSSAVDTARNFVVAGASYTDSSAVNGVAYAYSVIASNAWGSAPASDPVTATPRAPLVPGVPSGVIGHAGNHVDTISWVAATNATSYNVYRNVVGGASVKIGTTASLTFIDTAVVNGTGYVYRVSGVNGSLESAKSDSVLVTPLGVAPAKVTGLVATAGNHLVGLSWSPSLTATSYKVLRRGGLLATVAGTVYTDSTTLNDTTYAYKIVASNAWGDAPASDSVVATPRAPVGGLKVQYKVGATDVSTSVLKPFLQVVNTGATAIPLSDVTVRYWFTNDGTQSSTYWCDWAQIGASNIMGNIRTVSSPKPTADRYLEISFKPTAGNLAAGASTGEIQSRFSKSDWTNFTQTNDASFDATKSAYADWNKVTVYRAGMLVWGVEP